MLKLGHALLRVPVVLEKSARVSLLKLLNFRTLDFRLQHLIRCLVVSLPLVDSLLEYLNLLSLLRLEPALVSG